jgi:predicted RNase H-like HicB family nuclease
MKTPEEYLALPYTLIVRWSSEDELFVATVKEIKGCTGHGDTEAEAIAMARDNLAEWIAFSLERGDGIPVPREDTLPSGKWLQRVPRSLHAELVELAERDNTSLNQLVTSILSLEVGRRMNQLQPAREIAIEAQSGHDRWGDVVRQFVRWNVTRTMTHPYENIEDEYVRQMLKRVPNKISHKESLGGATHVEGRKVWEN